MTAAIAFGLLSQVFPDPWKPYALFAGIIVLVFASVKWLELHFRWREKLRANSLTKSPFMVILAFFVGGVAGAWLWISIRPEALRSEKKAIASVAGAMLEPKPPPPETITAKDEVKKPQAAESSHAEKKGTDFQFHCWQITVAEEGGKPFLLLWIRAVNSGDPMRLDFGPMKAELPDGTAYSAKQHLINKTLPLTYPYGSFDLKPEDAFIPKVSKIVQKYEAPSGYLMVTFPELKTDEEYRKVKSEANFIIPFRDSLGRVTIVITNAKGKDGLEEIRLIP